MSELREKQSLLVNMVGRLILYAESIGYELTFGDGYRDPRATFPYSHSRSLHKIRLAHDFNLFINGEREPRYDFMSWLPLGTWWENHGGTWGGRFLDKKGKVGADCGHFSLEHNGMK